MAGKVIGKSMIYGWLGKVTRAVDAMIVNRVVENEETTTDIKFGAPVFLNDDNTVRNMVGTDTTIAKFIGFAVAEVKQATEYGVDGNNSSYKKAQPCDVLTRGSVLVKVANGTPVAGGKVYLVYAADETANVEIGDISAAAITNKTVELTNCTFTTGYVDGNSSAEVTIKTKNLI